MVTNHFLCCRFTLSRAGEACKSVIKHLSSNSPGPGFNPKLNNKLFTLSIVTIPKLVTVILYYTTRKKTSTGGYHLTIPENYFKWILTYISFDAFVFQES